MADTNWTIRIFKSWGAADLSRAWVNGYELISDTPRTPDELIPVLNTLVAAEKTIHQFGIQFLQGLISTWVPDSKPYNPNSFVTVPLSGGGNLSGWQTSDLLDSNVCLMVRYKATLGRSGRRFYRGGLTEADVSPTGDGKFQIATGSPFADTGSAMSAFRTAITPLLPGGAGIAKLNLLGKGVTFPSTARPVTTITLGGVVVNKRNHRFFNRQTAFG